MNFIGERETAGNVVKKRCSEIGMLFRILFWISLLFLAAKVIWTIYIGTMPEASFRLTLMEAEGLTYGVAFYGAVRGIGLLVVVYSLIHTLVLPLLCSALGLGRAQVSLVDGKMVLVGCLIISLSYIFEYGSALQQEADETL